MNLRSQRASHPVQHALSLALVGAAASASAGDLALVAHGTLTQTLAPIAGPLSGAAIGDRFTARFVVDAAPQFLTPTSRGYTLQVQRGSLVVEDERAMFDNLAPLTQFSVTADEPQLGDSLDVYVGLAQSAFDVQLLVRDLQGGMLGSPFLAQNLGALTIPAAGNLAQLVLRDASQAVTTVGHVHYVEVVDLAAQPGENLCAPAANASGRPARIAAEGSALVLANQLTLRCTDMPQGVFGYFLVSRTEGYAAAPGGSRGTLCLGGALGRFSNAAANSGLAGTLALPLDLGALPQPAGPAAVLPGDTWFFQAWFRDFAGVTPSSNFSDSVAVRFL